MKIKLWCNYYDVVMVYDRMQLGMSGLSIAGYKERMHSADKTRFSHFVWVEFDLDKFTVIPDSQEPFILRASPRK